MKRPPCAPSADSPSASTSTPVLPLSENGKPCGRCGTVNEPDAGDCQQCHAFLRGNPGPVTTGLYRVVQPTDVQAEAEDFIAGVIADRGGQDALSTIERGYVGNLATVATMLRLLTDDISARGMFTRGGTPRRSYTAYLAGVDRYDRLAQRIGVERRARRLNIAQQFAEYHREQSTK